MTNRENPVWQMAFAAKFATFHMHATAKHQIDVWKRESEACADAAVEALGEQQPQPVTTPQSRDESSCGQCGRKCTDGRCVVCDRRWMALCGGSLPKKDQQEQLLDESRDVWVDGHGNFSNLRIPDWERYVPYSQLEADHRDACLLREIVDTYEHGDRVDYLIHYIILEREKRSSGDVATRAIRNEPSDSELLDAILRAHTEMSRVVEQIPVSVKATAGTRTPVSEAILRAITERAKR